MAERIKPTRSGLFAIELLIAVGVFSLCAAICVGLFVRSEIMSQDSADLNRAVSEARSVADCFKAAGGDLEKTAELTGGVVEDGRLRLLYDGSWQKSGDCGMGMDTVFLLEVQPEDLSLLSGEHSGYTAAALYVAGPFVVESLEKEDFPEAEIESELILAWEIAALEVAS